MADHPMIFSAPMVRALRGRGKSQTRRVLKPQPWDGSRYSGVHFAGDEPNSWFFNSPSGPFKIREAYAPGDRIWVKEAFRGSRGYDAMPPKDWGNKPIWYAADGDPDSKLWWGLSDRKRSSIHMPRWASRLTLTVTDRRVQRVQDISEEDAIAEGMIRSEPTEEDFEWERQSAAEDGREPGEMHGVWLAPGTRQGYGMTKEQRASPKWAPTAALAFRWTWEAIHGPDAWARNDWVCAVSFETHRGNIDQAQDAP